VLACESRPPATGRARFASKHAGSVRSQELALSEIISFSILNNSAEPQVQATTAMRIIDSRAYGNPKA